LAAASPSSDSGPCLPGEPPSGPAAALDHPIFSESLRRIRALLGPALADPAEQDVLERLVHSSGDPALAAALRFSPGACAAGMAALAAGAPILTDTAMAAAAVAPMARRTFANPVHCLLDLAPAQAPPGQTRTALGMAAALALPLEQAPLVLVGSAPTALEALIAGLAAAANDPEAGQPRWHPALVVGMPVGFVGVAESKRHLAASGLTQIRLEGSKGGAGLVAAATNALLRRAWLLAAETPPP